MATAKFDLIVLGSGPSAQTVARKCAAADQRVAVVEAGEFGGTCALRGCNPKKVFTNAAELLDQYQGAQGKLIRGDTAEIHWTDLVAFQHEFTDPVRERTEASLKKAGIATFQGAAQFIDQQTLQLGADTFTARRVFIGVGARPAKLDIPGEAHLVTSDTFMELPSLPPRILFLGGGYISFEFAHVAARLNRQVHIVDRHERPLRGFDPDLVDLLLKKSSAVGITHLAQTEALAIEPVGSHFRVTLKTETGRETVETDLVVHGGGRTPNLEGLNLAAAKVDVSDRGIAVNEFLQSMSNPAIYAAGDCADLGRPLLTPTANESARAAAANLIEGGNTQAPDYGSIPQVVFTAPPLAAVGMLDAEARKRQDEVEVRYEDLSTKGSIRKLCQSVAGCKLIIEKQSDRILGAHLLGPHADEVINLFALAIKFKLTARNLKSTLFTFPTVTAELRKML